MTKKAQNEARQMISQLFGFPASKVVLLEVDGSNKIGKPCFDEGEGKMYTPRRQR